MTLDLNLNQTALNSALTLRNARWKDLNAVTELIYAVCEADGDVTVAATPDDMKNWWETENFDPTQDAFVVENDKGQIVGYEELANEDAHADLSADGYVHPQFKGRGIGTTLLRAAEARAQQHIPLAESDLRVFIRAATDQKDEGGRAMFVHEGYSLIRHHWRMEIQLKDIPAARPFPSGVELRPFLPEEHARAVWQAENESFRDHWGSHDATFENWQHKKLGREGFDPALWLIAWDGDEVAGFSQNRYRMGIGWVGTLGVRHPWRKRGLGLALLNQSFRDFYQRGFAAIGLGVDASNPSGATRLYKRAGMYAASEFVMYEKTIRPGREISVESISE